MNRTRSFFSRSLTAIAISLLVGLSHSSHAQLASEGTVDLLTTPPELTANVAPNVVLTFDDSGSMAWTYMPDQRPYDSAAWGNPFQCAAVINPNAAASAPESWPMNGVYYNPKSTYLPPQKADGTQFLDAPFTAAWDNGILKNRPVAPSTSTTRNLTTYSFCGKAGAGYFVYTGPALALDATSGKLTATSLTNLYKSGNWTWTTLPSAQQQNFANWYSYYRTRNMAAITAVSRAYASFDKSIRVAWQNINTNWLAANTTKVLPFEGTTRTSFYNDWLFQIGANGGTPNQAAAVRVGQLFQVKTGYDTNPYWDNTAQKELSCRKNFHIQMTDGLWNGSVATTTSNDTSPLPRPLPDGRSYEKIAQSKIFWNEDGPDNRSMADIAFHYWATDLRPDFKNNEQTKLKVRPYLLDRTTGVTGNKPLALGDNWLENKEIYWNPANDPATWPHLVQFMIGFGVDGTIPKTAKNYEQLRLGQISWPTTVLGTDDGRKIDDMWHAALNSRGEFFAAANPTELIEALQKIIASVVAQSTASTPASVSLPILTGGNSAYQGGYDSGNWSGSFRRSMLDAAGMPADVVWDAGCILTGGSCSGAPAGGSARDPNSRIIVTSDGSASGRAFRWSSLTALQQNALNQKPGAAACAGTGTTNCDGYGSARLNYLRGARDNETGTAVPPMRVRTSLLGAVVNGEPSYVSSPRGGYYDTFPVDSPEFKAAAESEEKSYAGYQNAQRARRPMTYVGANDGMLHAFDADTGKEHWAFVPDTIIRNGRIAKSTARDASLVPGVDSMPRERDVFIKGKWRTILLGSLRLGGRGLYALDVTTPVMASETAATGTDGLVLWEFSSGTTASSDGDAPCATGARTCASLGYTYDSANVARIAYQDKWVAVVSSGYFPSNLDAAAAPGDRTEAAAKRTSLLVIDLETGQLIREIRTSLAPQQKPAGFRTFGLSTPMVYDVGSDQVDDLVYAGDLAGNLWRFNIASSDPQNWTVDLMFTTYGNGGAAKAGDQPIVFNPTALRDAQTRGPILVFGTGKYLGKDDRTTAIPEQAFYGIRDYGARWEHYPISVGQLVTQTMEQGVGNARAITGFVKPDNPPTSDVPLMQLKTQEDGKAVVKSVAANGWRIRLNEPTEKGERAQRRAIPLPTVNVALLYGLIPKSDDPCDPGARYSIMALDAGTGQALWSGTGIDDGRGLVGSVLSAPSPPSDPVVKRGGGGGVIVGLPPGLPPAVKDALDEIMRRALPPWHRSAWRELLGW